MPCILKQVATDKRRGFIWRSVIVAAGSACLITAPTLAADPVPQNDLLNAELWMQTAIEYRANCFMVYALAKVRLDEVLADRNWTAYDQSGSYQNFPRPERRSADVRSEGGRFRQASSGSGRRRPGHPGECHLCAGLFRRGHRRHDGIGYPCPRAQPEFRARLAC